MGNDVAKILGYKNPRDATSKHVEDSNVIKISWVEATDKQHSLLWKGKDHTNKTLINGSGVRQLVASSRLPNAIELAKRLDIEVLVPLKEQNTLNYLMSVFCDEQLEIQYPISKGKYKIDLYLPRYNLAIECDEFGHADRPKGYDETRQRYIENKLGCHFIRYNPDSEDFNINNVVREIRQYILKSFIHSFKIA